MKIFLLNSLLLFILSSCSLKEMADRDFGTKSSIDAIVKPQTIAQRFGDGKNTTVKLIVPLTEDTLGYYDVEDVLESTSSDKRKKNMYQKVTDFFKTHLYDLAVKLDIVSNIKYSTTFKFIEVDPRIWKSAKVTRAFFTTEDCRPEEENCNKSSAYATNLDFVSQLKLNISTYDPLSSQSLDEVEFVEDDDLNGGVNLFQYENDFPNLNLKESFFDQKNKVAIFKIEETAKTLVIKYFKDEKYIPFDLDIIKTNLGIKIALGDEKLFNKFEKMVREEQDGLSDRIIIYRLSSKRSSEYTKAVKYFKSPAVGQYVKKVFTVGRSIYVELKNSQVIDDFLAFTREDKMAYSELAIYKVDTCNKSNCIEIRPKNINLVPMLMMNPTLQLDTFLSVDGVKKTDFKYNGFVELEISLELPL